MLSYQLINWQVKDKSVYLVNYFNCDFTILALRSLNIWAVPINVHAFYTYKLFRSLIPLFLVLDLLFHLVFTDILLLNELVTNCLDYCVIKCHIIHIFHPWIVIFNEYCISVVYLKLSSLQKWRANKHYLHYWIRIPL